MKEVQILELSDLNSKKTVNNISKALDDRWRFKQRSSTIKKKKLTN